MTPKTQVSLSEQNRAIVGRDREVYTITAADLDRYLDAARQDSSAERAEGRPSPEARHPMFTDPVAWWAETGTAGSGEGCNRPFWLRHEAVEYVRQHGGYVKPLYTALSTPSPERAELTADFAKAFPGGAVDDSTFEAIESALDKADAPCQGPDGRWLTLPERIKALAPPRADGEEDVLARAGYARPSDITQTLMGPHEWGYRDPVEGGFIEDPAPFAAAELISYLRAERAEGATAGEVKSLDPNAIAEAMENGDGFWRSCSGCYETNEGYPTAPRDRVFKTELGGGCGECGGLGAIWWDRADYEAFGAAPSQVGKEEAQSGPDDERRDRINALGGYQTLFDAIAAATKPWPSKDAFSGISISVFDFIQALPPAPAAEPAISTDGPHEISKTRKWLARQLLDSMLSEKEAFSVVAYSPALEGVRPPAEPAISREEIEHIIEAHLVEERIVPAIRIGELLAIKKAADAILSKLKGKVLPEGGEKERSQSQPGVSAVQQPASPEGPHADGGQG